MKNILTLILIFIVGNGFCQIPDAEKDSMIFRTIETKSVRDSASSVVRLVPNGDRNFDEKSVQHITLEKQNAPAQVEPRIEFRGRVSQMDSTQVQYITRERQLQPSIVKSRVEKIERDTTEVHRKRMNSRKGKY